MLIYIEGLDRSGKSTFAKQVAAALRLPIYRKSPPKKLDLTEHHSYFKGVGFALMELHNLFQFNAIVDRSFISDWVYTNRNAEVRPMQIWREWENRHAQRHCAIIAFVEVPRAILGARVSAEPDPYMSVGDIPRFAALYDTYLRHTRFRVVRVNGIASPTERVDEIKTIERIITINSGN